MNAANELRNKVLNFKLKLLKTEEVAEILGVAPGTVRNWRCQGKGPEPVKLPSGQLRYKVTSVEKYIDSLMEA